MSSSDSSIRLDTGAFGAARRARAGRTAAYWLVLLAGAALIAASIAVAATLLTSPETRPATLRPAAAATADRAEPARVARAATKQQPAGQAAAAAVAPPPRATPVVVWNGYGGQGAANAIADQARAAGYPIVGVRDAPRRNYRATYVLYVPGQEAAARALARRLKLQGAAIRPLDGIRPAAIRPARLLVILSD